MESLTLTKQEAGEVELDFADEIMPEFEAPANPEYFELWLGDGTLLERSNSLGAGDLPRIRTPAPEPRFRDRGLPDGRRGRLVQIDFVPQAEEDEDEPLVETALDPTALDPATGLHTAVLVVARSREDLDARIAFLNLALTAVVALLLAAIAILVRLSLKLGLEPLDAMTRQVRALDAGSLEARLEVPQPPQELAPVIEQLNALLQRLESAFDRERRLSSNVAHELRTAIAELRNLAEVGGRWPDDRRTVARFFDDVRDIALQMEKIVGHLLALARYDSGLEGVRSSPVRVAEVVESAWRLLAREAQRKDLHLIREISPALRVEIDPDKLELMVSNLLSNAVAYSPAGGAVRCESSQAGGKVTLTISNLAEQLQAEDLPLMFDRFWRKDPARTGGQHIGLGLSLVRAFADLLGIEVAVDLDSEQTFSIALSALRAVPGEREMRVV